MFCSSESWESVIGLSEGPSGWSIMEPFYFPYEPFPLFTRVRGRWVLGVLARFPHHRSPQARPSAPTLSLPCVPPRAPSVFLRAPLLVPSFFLPPFSVLLPALSPVPSPPPRPPTELLPWHLLSPRHSLGRQMERQSALRLAMRSVTLSAVRRVLGQGPCRPSRPRRCPVPPWFQPPGPAR